LFVGCQLSQLASLLITLNFAVARILPYLDRDFWFLAAEPGDVLPGCLGMRVLDGVAAAEILEAADWKRTGR